MCTITYIPSARDSDEFLITSNRDESINRPAILPEFYTELGTSLYYPKDKSAGGTWIGVSRKNRIISLMNGAFGRQDRNPPYRKSRGIVVKELLAMKDLSRAVRIYDFEGIEAFFAVIFTWDAEVGIYELIWDEQEFYLKQRNAETPHIWSSMMSYSPAQHEKRKNKFTRFLKDQDNSSPEQLWNFHHDKGTADQEGILINRGELQTTSISQFQHFVKAPDTFQFEDLISGETQKETVHWD